MMHLKINHLIIFLTLFYFSSCGNYDPDARFGLEMEDDPDTPQIVFIYPENNMIFDGVTKIEVRYQASDFF